MFRKRLTFLILLFSTQLSLAQTTWDDLPIDVMVQILEEVLVAQDKNESALPLITKTTNKYLGQHTSLFLRLLKEVTLHADTFCPFRQLLNQCIWTQPDEGQFYAILDTEIAALIEQSEKLSLMFDLLRPKIRAMGVLAKRRQNLIECIETLMTRKYYDHEASDSDDDSEDNEKENLEHRINRLATIKLMPLDYALSLFRRVHKQEQKEETGDEPKAKRARVQDTAHSAHCHRVPNLIQTLKECIPHARSNALRRVCANDAEILEVYSCLTDNFNLRYSQ